MKGYGIFIGRFQPFHIGHQAVVNEILLDGRVPILVLGSSNEDRDLNKNPLSFKQRRKLIKKVYPNTKIIFVKNNDYTNWDKWYHFLAQGIYNKLKTPFVPLSIFYYNEKEVDRTSFTFNGKNYVDTWFTDIFKDLGYCTKKIALAERADINIQANARDIRHSFEDMKHLLDARVYEQLKKFGWE